MLFTGDAARATDTMTGEGIGQALETGRAGRPGRERPGRGPELAARYAGPSAGLAVDDRVAAALSRVLGHPEGASGAIRLTAPPTGSAASSLAGCSRTTRGRSSRPRPAGTGTSSARPAPTAIGRRRPDRIAARRSAAPTPGWSVKSPSGYVLAVTKLGFDGDVAIVTGAGGGIGREHTLLLASRGARIVVNDIGGDVNGAGTDRGPAERVASEIRDLGGEAVADTHSVATPEGGEAIVTTALDAFGRVDVVVNNAGILRDRTFQNVTAELLDPVIAVHLAGAFNVTRPAWVKIARAGLRSGRQHVIELGHPRQLRAEQLRRGEDGAGRLHPGPRGGGRQVQHQGERHRAARQDPDDRGRPRRARFAALDPRLVSPVVCFLAHRDVPLSGEVLTVGGGRVARFFIGMTTGYFNRDLSPEDVRDHLDAICDEAGYSVPGSAADEFQVLADLLGRG